MIQPLFTGPLLEEIEEEADLEARGEAFKKEYGKTPEAMLRLARRYNTCPSILREALSMRRRYDA